MPEIKWTNKQIEIIKVIAAKNEDGTLCSVYDIMEKLSYPVKRDALLHSIRPLVFAGYIERREREVRDGRSVQTFGITAKAMILFKDR